MTVKFFVILNRVPLFSYFLFFLPKRGKKTERWEKKKNKKIVCVCVWVGSLLLLRCRNFCWLAAVCVPRYWRGFSWGFWNTFDTYREDREKKKKGWHSFAESVGNLSSFWPPPPMPPSSSILRWSRTIVWWFAWDIERERRRWKEEIIKKGGK